MSDSDTPTPDRRKFLGTASTLAMAGGLAASYGTFFAYAGRFLYPAGSKRTRWMFVTEVERLPVGESVDYRSPGGANIVVTRHGRGAEATDFRALSGTCPHLGCQVHWEPQNNRFFCPCHNGVFDPEGLGTEGPPEGQQLMDFPLKVEHGLLYIEVPLDQVARAGQDRPGHDPCLRPEESF